MLVFSSGSCRLLTSISDGYGVITPLHSMINQALIDGINFLGKFHNIKQHIQFIKYIRKEIDLPDKILCKFFTSLSTYHYASNRYAGIKLQKIREEFEKCDVYIFEICSLKLYSIDGYQVQHELILSESEIKEDGRIHKILLREKGVKFEIQTEEDLIRDLEILRSMLPNKRILFQTHFRPNIIYNNLSLKIESREKIYRVLSDFSKKFDNIEIHDPSLILREDNSLFDGDTHWDVNLGHSKNFASILKILLKINT